MTNSTPDIARDPITDLRNMHREYLERAEKRHAEAMAGLAELSAVLTARIPPGAKPMTDIVERLEEVSAIVQKEFGRVAGSACLSTEAAAEIRRLREQCEAMREARGSVTDKTTPNDLTALAARMQEAQADEQREFSLDELIAKLMEIHEDDHARGCEGRTYECTCGWDERAWDTALEAAAVLTDFRLALHDAIDSPKGVVPDSALPFYEETSHDD